jgi:hypothetical protein
MKIANTGPVTTMPLRPRDRTSRSSSSFAGELSGDKATREAAAPSGVPALNTLLTIQEVGDPLEGRRRAVKRGEDLLDRLDELRHGLLTGIYPAEKLDQLLVLVRRQQDRIADSRLLEILADIELRASVELAKLGRHS